MSLTQATAWHLFPVVLNSDAMINRDRFIEILLEHGIGTSVHYKPLHRMTYYRQQYDLLSDEFPGAERIWQGCVSLPHLSDILVQRRSCLHVCNDKANAVRIAELGVARSQHDADCSE